MKPANFSFNWFDILVVVLLIIGLFRGRKRGMSEELLDLFQWLLMVVLAGFMYKPLGVFFRQFTGFPLLITYVSAYVLVLISVKIVFTLIKRVAGEKLVGSDLFGRLEYYLGMLAGMARWACMLFVGLALLNAYLITDQEYEARVKESKQVLGDDYFTIFSLGFYQRSAFRDSQVGPWIKKYFDPYLIESTAITGIQQQREQGLGKQKERELDELIKGKR